MVKAKEVTVGAGASVASSAAPPSPARHSRRTRSRLGCYTCRRRKRKCDESYPVCQRCAAKGLPCEWPPQKHKLSRVLNQVVYVGPGLSSAASRADATSFVPAHKHSGPPQREGPSERPPSGVRSATDAAAPAGAAPATPPTVGSTTGIRPRPRSRYLAKIALQQEVIAERDPDDIFEYLDPSLWATT